jgi:hypothetical protein
MKVFRKFISKGKLLLVLLMVVSCTLLFIPKIPALAGTIAEESLKDDFSSDTINSEKWQVKGDGLSVADTSGALKMKTVNGYSHSIIFQAFEFEAQKNYTIEFDTSIKSAGETWLGIILGGTGVGATYEKKSSNGILLSATAESTRVDNYKQFLLQTSERATTDVLTNKGNSATIKLEIIYSENTYKCNFYIKNTNSNNYGEKLAELSIAGIAGYLGFQSNGIDATTKIMNLKIFEGEQTEAVANENFETSTETLIGSTSITEGFRWIAQNLEYTSGIGKVAKFTNAVNAKLITNTSLVKYDGNVTNFSLSLGFGLATLSDAGKFGVMLGMENKDTDGDYIYFLKNETGCDLMLKRLNEEAIKLKSIEMPVDASLLKMIGKYNNEVDVYLDGKFIATAENVNFVGYLAIASYGESEVQGVTASLYSAELISYSYVVTSNNAISNNFNAFKNGSTTIGYVDNTKWKAEGNCAVRNGVLKFQSGDVNTSFNTKEKYQDYILRFDVTKITGSYTRDEDSVYSTPGTYSDMSIGVSLGKQAYNESSIAGLHPSIQFCTKYWNNNEEGKIVPNMIIWGYGLTMADGAVAGWPKECWWHDGSDGKVVTGTDGLKINVMIVAKNRTITVYYKYSNQNESCFDEAKAVYVNVNTYGYVAISCGYNSTFEVDNLSITPLSFENYL